MKLKRRALVLALLGSVAATAAARPSGQEQAPEPASAAWTTRYELPSESVQRLFEVDKNYEKLDNLGPDKRHFLIAVYDELSTIARMGEPTQRLAMLELRGQRGRTSRLDTYGIRGLKIFDIESRETRPITLPDDSLVSDMMWSPDGDRIAFLLHGPDRTEVWTADVNTAAASRLSDAPVMATLGTRSQGTAPRVSRMLQWTSNDTVITLLVADNRGEEPSAHALAVGPIVRHTRPTKQANPTYPFLLQDNNDAERFRFHTTSQIAELAPGVPPRRIGEPGMFESISLSPDRQYLLAERIVEPLSPLVSYSSFGRTLEVVGVDGTPVATVRERALREGRSGRDGGADRDLQREVAWMPGGSTLGYLHREPKPEEETDDDAASSDSAKPRDRIVVLDAPFDTATAQTVASSQDTLSGLLFSADRQVALVNQAHDGDKRSLVVFSLDGTGGEPVALTASYDPGDPLALPGAALVMRSGNGVRHARQPADRSAVYLQGAGYQADFRPRPFIDRVALDGSNTARQFEGSASMYERPLAVLDDELERLVVQRESRTVFPDSWLWTQGDGFDGALTHSADPFPEITAVKRLDFDFTRRDGLVVQGRVSMPVGWRDGDAPVPAMFWTYPSEYRSDKDYQRDAIRDRNHNAFTHLSYLRWSDIWLSQGYALVHPDVPIVGETYNDNYIQDLSDSLYAAIRRVDGLGLVDVDRIGHGGHSYGAFATGNLLANTPYFKAGIAGDGAYNRTLTPMGFQAERRFLWQNQDVYLEMSPFFQADHIDTPLLMYHGGSDNNTGTWPVQSVRMMQALTGLGKTAALYVYPYESHAPRAIESYLDLWKRLIEWFDRYVKNPDVESSNTEHP